ncbi:conserved oligomeric Golgi complex subunit 2 isoform X2 [Adelges cooleyi]|nr:conserved oligomeric Golgi complex subunit 2 isoform X2 [Adelges cooleyi]
MTLENMRVEMGIFLKDLRNKMINSLNDDCDKYFHLSRGLIGIDHQLATLKPGLHSISHSVQLAKKNLENTLQILDEEIQLNKRLCENKQAYYAIIEVQNSLEKLEKLLNYNGCDVIILTRVIAEYNRLTSYMEKSSKIVKQVHFKKKTIIYDLLITNLNRMFIASLKTNSKTVRRYLELYLSLGRIKSAEDVCRSEMIAPKIASLLNENNLVNCNDGLNSLYNKSNDFLLHDLKNLLEAAVELNILNSKLYKFDFITKSYWPEISSRLQNNLKSIYNLREPDVFIKNYKITFEEFMKHLNLLSISQCESQPLYALESYNDFKMRWNLPVYYQYRYQEIGYWAESVMNNESYDMCDDNYFKLKVTKTIWDCMCFSLDQNVFIIDLSHRFFKLILQLISRYQTWANDVISKSKMDIKEFITRVKFLENLEEDLKGFYVKFNDFCCMLEQLLQTKIPKELLEQQKNCIMNVSLDPLVNSISKFKVQIVIDEAMSHVIRVTDVPRLFRHTNRECPTEPCAYMKSIVTALKILQNNDCKKQVLDYVVTQYVAYIDDVVKAIKKTEESLRKLKKVRDPNYKVNMDDDKIRCQLSLDVNFLFLSIGSMSLPELDEIEAKLERVKENMLIDKNETVK